jgi:hypothetical protein
MAGVDESPGVLLADAGYWHGEQMQTIVNRGIQVLIPPDTSRRRKTRRNWQGGHYDFMRRVLATDHGGELYRKRQPMIEPVFAQTKFNRGIDRFRRRGRAAVRAEWRLITATHNLLKTPPARDSSHLTPRAGAGHRPSAPTPSGQAAAGRRRHRTLAPPKRLEPDRMAKPPFADAANDIHDSQA